MKLENSTRNLDYKIINLTSIEQNDQTNVIPFDKLPRLLRINGTPWTSERFCSYPQKIIIKFPHLVNISQINILSHSKKISRRLQFYYYYPEDFDKNKQYEYDEIPFRKLGFINLRDNKQCNYSVRELKKIFVKIRCLFIKIELENNYKNYYNKYQQVGISCIEFIGRYLGKYLNFLSNNEYDEKGVIKSNIGRILNEVCPDTFNNLNKFVNNKKNYNYSDYDDIKGRLDDIKSEAKKIYQVELLEKEASRDNDFDKAIELKNKKEKGKYKLKEKASEINKLYKSDFHNNNLDLERNIDKNYENGKKINNENENGNENSLNNGDNNINSSKKMTKSFSAPEINSQNDNNTIKNLNQTIPLEELDPKHIKNFNSLINFINQDGLRNLLSPKIANKLEGIKLLNSKLDELFSSSGDELYNNILQLLDAIGLILEDKNTLFLKQISDLMEGTIKRISYDENMKNDPKIKTSLNKNIVNKVKEYIGLGTEFKKQGKFDKATELFLLILDKNILNFDNLVKSLLLDDINILNSNENPINNINTSNNNNNNLQNNKINSKLNIIKKILEDFDNKVDDNITTKEAFPKEAIAEFILLNMNNKDNKIKKLINDLLKLYIDLFGFEDLQEKSLYYFKGQNELEKIANQFPALKPLFNKFLTNSEVNIFIPSQTKQKPKLIKNSFEINYLYKKYNGKNINDIDMNNIENSDNNKKNENICELCKINIGEKSNEEHIKECKMYTTCEACSEIIKVELLNNHRLELCINKNNYKQCNKCKEAIPNEIYNLHIEKNVCNPIKSDMSRCPFCHHDIEKEQEGFYQHLVIDGCAYQI